MMNLHILSRGAIAAFAGATMLAASSAPSSAFTLPSPSLEQPVAAADVQSVWWHGGWHQWLASWLAWRMASGMGMARRLASLGMGSAIRLRSGLPLLVDPVGPPLRGLRLGRRFSAA